MIKDILIGIGLFYFLPVVIVCLLDTIDGNTGSIEKSDPDE